MPSINEEEKSEVVGTASGCHLSFVSVYVGESTIHHTEDNRRRAVLAGYDSRASFAFKVLSTDSDERRKRSSAITFEDIDLKWFWTGYASGSIYGTGSSCTKRSAFD